MSTLETAQYYYGNALASTKDFKVVGDALGATTAPTSDACC